MCTSIIFLVYIVLNGKMDQLLRVALVLAGVSTAKNAKRIKGPGTLDAFPGEFPYFVTILHKWTGDLIGSGVLIKPQVVLAAASDIEFTPSSRITVVLGVHDRSNKLEETRQEISVSNLRAHPDYLATRATGDIALLRLERAPKIGKKKRVKVFKIKNIMSSRKEDRDILGNSASCVVPGFGLIEWTEYKQILPQTLKKFIPEMQKREACFGSYGLKEWLCSLNADQTSTCMFDSGSPLLCKKNGRMKLYGLTMAEELGVSRYCDAGVTFYTRMSPFYQWIKETAHLLQREV